MLVTTDHKNGDPDRILSGLAVPVIEVKRKEKKCLFSRGYNDAAAPPRTVVERI